MGFHFPPTTAIVVSTLHFVRVVEISCCIKHLFLLRVEAASRHYHLCQYRTFLCVLVRIAGNGYTSTTSVLEAKRCSQPEADQNARGVWLVEQPSSFQYKANQRTRRKCMMPSTKQPWHVHELDRKRVLVTGGTQGMGKAIVQ